MTDQQTAQGPNILPAVVARHGEEASNHIVEVAELRTMLRISEHQRDASGEQVAALRHELKTAKAEIEALKARLPEEPAEGDPAP